MFHGTSIGELRALNAACSLYEKNVPSFTGSTTGMEVSVSLVSSEKIDCVFAFCEVQPQNAGSARTSSTGTRRRQEAMIRYLMEKLEETLTVAWQQIIGKQQCYLSQVKAAVKQCSLEDVSAALQVH